MIAESSADNNFIAGFNPVRPPIQSLRNNADSAGINENFVNGAALHNFGIASDDLNTCMATGRCH